MSQEEGPFGKGEGAFNANVCLGHMLGCPMFSQSAGSGKLSRALITLVSGEIGAMNGKLVGSKMGFTGKGDGPWRVC